VWFFALLFIGAVIFPSRINFIAGLLHELFKGLFGVLGMPAEAKYDNEESPKEKPSAASIEQRIAREKSVMSLVAVVGCISIFVFIYTDGHPLSILDRSMPDLPDTQLQSLEFTCVHEADVIPKRDPEADQLYQHAKWLKKNNLLKEDPLVYPKIERFVRIASAYGHDKASLELSQMIGKGTAGSSDIVNETLDLTQELIDRGTPGGFYDMGRYLEQGYGVKKDPDLALKYFRKSADMGSPEGQYLVGDRLTGIDDKAIQAIGTLMWRCAVEQGHGEAGLELGIWLKGNRNTEAIQAFQLGAKAGNDTAASALRRGFDGPPTDDRLEYLGQQKDTERVKRYRAIWSFLADYSYLNPKVPEIDQIAPLPPAKLPAWDGTFQWLKAHEANVPPPLPAEERIKEMAQAKGLDPETGRPGKGKHAEAEPAPAPVKVAVPVMPLGTTLASGAACPQAGYWECAADPAIGDKRRFIPAGMALPTVVVRGPERSFFNKLKGEPANAVSETAWTLMTYADKNAS